MRTDEELAARMAEMEPELLQLLQWEVNSLPCWDVLRYFLENEYTSATLDDLSFATGRDTETLLTATGGLVSAGWLARRTVEGETQYTLTQELERRRRLSHLHAMMGEHDFRLKALYHWLRPHQDDLPAPQALPPSF